MGAKNLELAEAKDELQKGLEAGDEMRKWVRVDCDTCCNTHVTCGGRPS